MWLVKGDVRFEDSTDKKNINVKWVVLQVGRQNFATRRAYKGIGVSFAQQ